MRWGRTIFFLIFLAHVAWADTIHLKNGTAIICDKASDKGDQVEYWIGTTAYRLPKSVVANVEHGGAGSFGISIGAGAPAVAAPASSGNASVIDLSGTVSGAAVHKKVIPTPPPKPRIGQIDLAALKNEILNSDGVDEGTLYGIEAQGNSNKSAAAYFLAALYEYEHERTGQALQYVQRAIHFAPGAAGLVPWYAVLLLDSGQYAEAVTQSERAAKRDPSSPDVQRILGFAYYGSGRLQDAIGAWKRSLELQPDERLKPYLAKAEREAKVEENFNEMDSVHFVLRFEGRKPAYGLTNELLRTLDRQYQELASDLGFAPDAPIAVILYTEQQFFDVTQAPSWAGALNNGKLRIPVRDVPGVTPQIEMVLKHELTHSFVHAAAHRCPVWLHEGLAQMEEPRSTAAFAPALEQLFRSGRAAPFRVLEGSFTRFNSAQAQVAYAESLAAAEYMRSAYGMNGLRRMLNLLADGEAPEAALRAVTQGGYSKLESEIANYLGNER